MRNLFKKIAIPLQAISVLVICLGMFWMIFVIANFSPAPPTALDLQARSTEENLSFASMNSTAAALALEMVSDEMPSPIVMPVTGNSTPIPISSPTIAVTLHVVSPASETETPPLFSIFSQHTATRKPRIDPPTLTATLAPTHTPIPTSTTTRIPSRTPSLIPTVTRTKTPVPTPSATEQPPTNTPATPTTSIPPMETDTPQTPTPGPTEPPTEPPVDTPAPLNSPEPIESSTEELLYP